MPEHTYTDDTRDHSGRDPKYPAGDDVHELLRAYIQHLYDKADDHDSKIAGEDSVDRYTTDIRWYQQWLNEKGLTPLTVDAADAQELGTRLNRDYAGITARNRWRIIDDCHSHLVKRKDRDENPLAVWDDPRNDFGMTYTVEQDKHLDPDEEQYAVTESEVRKMENHVSIEPMRDRLLIRLLWQTGLRKGEAVGIEIKDHLDMDARTIRIPAANAKTNQSRVVGYQPSLDGLLRKWLYDGYRDRYSVAEDSPYLFVSRRSPQLSRDAVTDVVVEAACDAGINRELYTDAQEGTRWKITPHNIRHGFASEMIRYYDDDESPVTLYQVSQALGHASVAVTQRMYVNSDEDAAVDAMHQYGPE